MRKLVLAGVAMAGAAAVLPASAWAQSAVFPETTRAGKLDGAAPGSVQVSIGGRLFAGIEFESGSGDKGSSRVSDPNLVDYIRLYPSFDYANPSGVHFGVSMELRTNGAQQGVGSGHNSIFGWSAQGYVSSEKFGKFAVGTPNSATDQLGVGTGDDFGTGGFYGEYGWVNAPPFAMTDAYDGDIPKQKIAYYSPSLAGFQLGLSYQPTSVGLNNSGALVDNLPAGNVQGAVGAQSRNRIEAALQFAQAFGPASVKADIGYAHASPSVVGNVGGYRDVNLYTAGAVVNVFGFEVEGSVVTGHWAYNTQDSGSPFGPSLSGSHSTTSYIVGAGYSVGKFSIGAQYYGVRFDAGDFGAVNALGNAATGRAGTVSGVAVGGSYVIGPGVAVNFDVATDTIKTPGATFKEAVSGAQVGKVHGSMGAVGAYFEW